MMTQDDRNFKAEPSNQIATFDLFRMLLALESISDPSKTTLEIKEKLAQHILKIVGTFTLQPPTT